MSTLQTEVAWGILATVQDLGEPVTLRKLNPGSGPHPTQTEVDYSALAMTQSYSIRNMTGDLVKSNQRGVIMDAIDVTGVALPTPMVNDRITIGGALYTITEVLPVLANGVAVAYRMSCQ